MRIHGIDFTSRPTRAKPIVVAEADLGTQLVLRALHRFTDFAGFEHWLATPGPWIGGFDFPFGLPRAFVDAQRPDADWPQLLRWARALGREGFCAVTHAAFSAARGQPGLKHRRIDALARSHSPLKTMDPVRRIAINPPVGLMFFEGAPRLLDAGLHLPGHHATGDARVGLEVYPGWLAQQLGERLYKNDSPTTAELRRAARRRLLARLRAGAGATGIAVAVPTGLSRAIVADAAGDLLDALLCAVVAAWAARRGPPHYGLPAFDPVEGWIAGVAAPTE
jgi:hypothetical protein